MQLMKKKNKDIDFMHLTPIQELNDFLYWISLIRKRIKAKRNKKNKD